MSTEKNKVKLHSGDGFQINEGYRDILVVFDLCFGIFSMLMAGLALIAAIKGRCGWITFYFLGSFVVANLALTQVSNRVKNRFRVEIFRLFIVNGLLGFFAFSESDGVFTHYWPCYLVMSFAGGTFLTAWMKHKFFAYSQIGFWLANFAVSNFAMAKLPMDWVQFSIIASSIAMSSALLIEMTQVFNVSLEKEKEMKAQLLQSSKMTALGEMAGGMAHEINNPLAIIHSHADLLIEMAAEPNPDMSVLQQLAGTIETTATRIAAIIGGLRSFARDGSGDKLEKTSVKKIVDETLVLCLQRLEGAGIQIESLVPEALFIACRAVQISQVLLNLILNAHDAIVGDNIQPKWIRIEAVTTEKFIEISVTDSGPGIPPEIYDKIMQPFFTTKPVGSGTGLGLSVSKGIIKAHRGQFFVDANAKHTCFVIQFPIVNAG